MWKTVSPLDCGGQGWEGTLGEGKFDHLWESERLAIKCRFFSALSRSSDLLLVLLTDALSWKWMFVQSSKLTTLNSSIPQNNLATDLTWHHYSGWLDVWREERGLKQFCNREGRQDPNSNVSFVDQKCDVNFWLDVHLKNLIPWCLLSLLGLHASDMATRTFWELSLDVWMQRFHTLLNTTRSLLKGKICFGQICKLLRILWFYNA